MNTLLAVVSAHTRDDWANAIRSTWVPLVPEGTVDVKRRFYIFLRKSRRASPRQLSGTVYHPYQT